jgi:hypothetical protein
MRGANNKQTPPSPGGACFTETPAKGFQMLNTTPGSFKSTASAPSGDVACFTILAAHGARLSKEYRLAADGNVVTDSGTRLQYGGYEVVAVDASDPVAALAKIGRVLEDLQAYKALVLGVPRDGTTTGEITVKARYAEAETDALTRSLMHFGWPEGPGLLLLDADACTGLREVLCTLYPPFADVAVLIRPSASASVVDPKTGERLKAGEHVYVIIDEPALAKETLQALVRLAWCAGRGGFLKLTKAGSVLVYGPVDATVGSPERLSYEGAISIGPGLATLPRACRVAGGNGVLCARALLDYAQIHAPVERFDELVAAAKAEPAFVAERERVQTAHRSSYVRAAAARGRPHAQAEAEYDKTIGRQGIPFMVTKAMKAELRARGVSDEQIAEMTPRQAWNILNKEGEREIVPLPPDHVLYWPNGEAFTVADIIADPKAFHGKECCDPVEGADYQSKNCAKIYAEPPQIFIHSFAHGGAFAYTAPLDWPDWSLRLSPFADLLRKWRAEHPDDWGFFTPPLPVVKLGPRLSKNTDAAETILLGAKVPLFQRGAKLVRPVVTQVQSFHGETTSAPQLHEITLPYLRDALCRHALWRKFDVRSKKWTATQPPKDAAQGLLDRFGDWRFPVIAGIIGTPTLRPDGTILAAPGHDAATQLLLIDPPAMPAIPERPTRADAATALNLLKELLAEFPFVDEVSRAVALSAQISTVCRGAFPIVPVHIVDAPTAGTGKSYLLSTQAV